MEIDVISCDACEKRVAENDLVIVRLRHADGRIRILDLHSACCEKALGAIFNGKRAKQ